MGWFRPRSPDLETAEESAAHYRRLAEAAARRAQKAEHRADVAEETADAVVGTPLRSRIEELERELAASERKIGSLARANRGLSSALEDRAKQIGELEAALRATEQESGLRGRRIEALTARLDDARRAADRLGASLPAGSIPLIFSIPGDNGRHHFGFSPRVSRCIARAAFGELRHRVDSGEGDAEFDWSKNPDASAEYFEALLTSAYERRPEEIVPAAADAAKDNEDGGAQPYAEDDPELDRLEAAGAASAGSETEGGSDGAS